MIGEREIHKDKGIFIPMDIWRIKNLNFNEKLVLSDMYNKTRVSEESVYNTKAETLAKFLYLDQFTVKDIFNSLQKKGYISSNPLTFRNKGVFKRAIARRKINEEAYRDAKRFPIVEDNVFFRNGKEGLFFTNSDFIDINRWCNKKPDGRALYSKIRMDFMLLYIIIRKAGFYIYDNKKDDIVFARFKEKELAEYLGVTRQTAGKYIKSLTSLKVFPDEKELRLVYDLGEPIQFNEAREISEKEKIYLTKEYRDGDMITVSSENFYDNTYYLGDTGDIYLISLSNLIPIGILPDSFIFYKKTREQWKVLNVLKGKNEQKYV